MKWSSTGLFIVLIILTAFGQAEANWSYVTLMTHDSFAVSEGLLKDFERQSGAEIKILKSVAQSILIFLSTQLIKKLR